MLTLIYQVQTGIKYFEVQYLSVPRSMIASFFGLKARVINVRKQPFRGMFLILVQFGHFGRKPLASNPSRKEKD